MPKNKGIYCLFRSKADFDAFKRDIIHFTRVYTLDDVSIALGRMGFTEEQFAQFRDIYSAVADENAHELLNDAEQDKDMWYSKECKERELQEHLKSLYVPREVRYG